jgi:hypothetical protein
MPQASQTAPEDIAVMAFAGVPPDCIAGVLKIPIGALRGQYGDALDVGQGVIIARLTRALLDNAMSGDTRAATFLLKACAGWRDSGPVSRPPAAAPTPAEAEAKRQLIERILAMDNGLPPADPDA